MKTSVTTLSNNLIQAASTQAYEVILSAAKLQKQAHLNTRRKQRLQVLIPLASRDPFDFHLDFGRTSAHNHAASGMAGSPLT